MSGTNTFLNAVVETLEQAGIYNKNDQCPPVAVLWTDKDRQWEALIPELREHLPLLVFGSYQPAQRTGPAYWLRCMIARTLPDDTITEDTTPIVYLPGISRKDIRAIEDCPRFLQPLAELQYRGTLWTQKNGRDWTLLAFMQSEDGGLGIDVASDTATKEALKRSLLKLADEQIAVLRQSAPLRADYFDALLNPDEIRSLLLWMNNPAGYDKSISIEEWQAFCQLCQKKYSFHPEEDGPITAAENLGKQKGNWQLVWQRYCESALSYPQIPDLLRKARPTIQLSLFEAIESWPQDNDSAEDQLRERLVELRALSHSDARSVIEILEESHASRREWVWARLDQAPLAKALGHLCYLARDSVKFMTGSTIDEVTSAYITSGWKVDASVLDALACVEQPEDLAAVKSAIDVFYQPWLKKAVSSFQQAVVGLSIPVSQVFGENFSHDLRGPGTCILFSDALRFDTGMRLASSLESSNFLRLRSGKKALRALDNKRDPSLS
jgi:hypothetical protein